MTMGIYINLVSRIIQPAAWPSPRARTIGAGIFSATFAAFFLTVTATIVAIPPAYGQSALASPGLSKLVQSPRVKPAAPGPTYLNIEDYRALKDVMSAVKNRRWASAKSAITRLSDDTARSLGTWYYLDARDPNVDVRSGTAFLDQHPDWPSTSRIQRHLESQLTNTTSPETIFKLFDKRDPITGNGKLQFIRTLMARNDIEAAKIYVRDSWRNHRFSSTQEKSILSNYGTFLRAEDHAARVDQLLWARQVSSSKRSFRFLSSSERRKASARAALYLRAANAERLFNALPAQERRDAGVMHAAIRYYRRGDNERKAISLVRELPDDPTLLRNPSRFWDERNLLMRWALKNGRFMDAYEMANAHGLEDGLDLAEAEFAAGWVALRFLQEPKRAEDHFLILASWATSPISTARAYYWLGRAASAQGMEELARTRYGVASRYIYTYYGQLAAEELGGVQAGQKFVPAGRQSPADDTLFNKRPTAKAFRMITDLNDRRSLLIFSYNLDDQLETPGEYLILSDLTHAERAPHLTIRAGKTAVRKKTFIPEVSYPLIPVPEEASRFVLPEVILGLSRQESEFNPRAYSSAGARGVMQLLPATAQLTARKERLPYSRAALLNDASYNMTIGSAHLSHLLTRFNGSYIMTFVGYNAGPHRADRWVREYGDPRSDLVDPIDWVELIPFSETRNYVQRVHENIQIYRARLNDTSIAGGLSKDLERGGTRNRAGRISRPSTYLDSLRPADDRRALPGLSTRMIKRLEQAPLSLPAATPQADHLGPQTPTKKALPEQAQHSSSSSSAPSSQNAPATLSEQPNAPSASTKTSAPLHPQSSDQTGQKQEPLPSIITPSKKPAMSANAPQQPGNSFDHAPIPTPTPTPTLGPSKVMSAEVSNGGASDEIADTSHNRRGKDTLVKRSEQVTQPAHSQDLNQACASYRLFVAEQQGNNANSAEDLNAAMLAELRGGSSCAPTPQPDDEQRPEEEINTSPN